MTATVTTQREFVPFPKIARLHRDMVVTEKIDGTNAAVVVTEDGEVYAQSRKRVITPEQDNFGFARWVAEHTDELRELGRGHHFGEWWGQGIQRGYGLDEKRFSLFNVARWGEPYADAEMPRPACCHVVPEIVRYTFDEGWIARALELLRERGSYAAPGFMDPEGIVVYHTASHQLFKVTLDNDGQPKSISA